APPGVPLGVGPAATLMLSSILCGENPFSRFGEHVFLGVWAGYGVYQIWSTNIFQNWYEPLFVKGQWAWTLALVAGLMYFTVYNPRPSWMSRVVMMMILGFDSGIYFRLLAGERVAQIGDSFRPLLAREAPYEPFSNIIFGG